MQLVQEITYLKCCSRVIKLRVEDEAFEGEVGRLLGNPMDFFSKVKCRFNKYGLSWDDFMESLK